MDEPQVYFPSDAFVNSTKPYRAGAHRQGAPARDGKSGKVDIGFFTMIPRRLFGSGVGAALGASAGWFYVALCERANREGGNTFKASDDSLASDTGMGTRTICDARKRLQEWKLIEVERKPGQAFKYTLLPQAFDWTPVKERARARRKPRGYWRAIQVSD